MTQTMNRAINAATGEEIAPPMTASQFERWDEQCGCDWRKPRDIAEVNPDLRDCYLAGDDSQGTLKTHYLVSA